MNTFLDNTDHMHCLAVVRIFTQLMKSTSGCTMNQWIITKYKLGPDQFI